MGQNSKTTRQPFWLLVFLTAFSCLMFELIISRVADFHLDFRNSFLAIPITFLGLALGSLHVHFRRSLLERFDMGRTLLLLTLISAATFIVVFLIFGRYLPVVGSSASLAVWKAAWVKIPLFILTFTCPFYFFGRILTISYYLNRAHIGTIYSADFFGAALACLVTPICLHYLQLSGVIFLFLLSVSVTTLFFLPGSSIRRVLLLLIAVTANIGIYFGIIYLDNTNNFSVFLPNTDKELGVEIAHGWNEFSRVSLAKLTNKRNGRDSYLILHDNAVSNVHVSPYRPGVFHTPGKLTPFDIPFMLRPDIREILVMFAGCGAEMIALHESSSGRANITGVEINPLVMELARDTPDLASYKLREFYSLPNINMCIHEGRSFLEADTKKYDLIFVGSKAAATVRLSGHTRKYLDTEEAYELYLRHLNPGGLLLFDHQPVQRTIQSLQWVFAKMNLPALGNSALIFAPWGSDDLLVSPDGFTESEMQSLLECSGANGIRYAPFTKTVDKSPYAELLTKFDPKRIRTTDDRPYESELEIQGYRLFPSGRQQDTGLYYMSWSKITTLIFVIGLTFLLLLVAQSPKTGRIPVATLFFLLITGFCYLVVEIIYLAKLELFIQNPLISMAAVLSIFLLCGGAGSRLFNRFSNRISMVGFPFLVAGIIFLTTVLLDALNAHCLSLALAFRLPIAAVAIAPTAIGLGMFYPYAVTALVRNRYEQAVPLTYAVSTLSSVIGATYAMTFVINWGGDFLLMQAAVGYVLLGLFMVMCRFVWKGNSLAA